MSEADSDVHDDVDHDGYDGADGHGVHDQVDDGVDDPDRASGQRRPTGALSGQVLEVLLAAGRALTPGEVQRALAEVDPRPLAYTTVVTVLSRLHAQGLADRFRSGRAFAYLAVADHSRLAARRMRRVLDAENDRDSVLASFVNDLNGRDEDVLRRLLGISPDSPPTGQDT